MVILDVLHVKLFLFEGFHSFIDLNMSNNDNNNNMTSILSDKCLFLGDIWPPLHRKYRNQY